jgi:hypothetical protein
MAIWALGRLCEPASFIELAQSHAPQESDEDVAAEWRADLRA